MRVSTEDQAEQGTIEAQRDFLHKFTNLYQLPVADEYADDGVTGTLLLGERPEGQRLLQDAETGRFSAVLVYRMTRLGRSLKALIDAHDRLSGWGVTLRSATEPFDTSTSIGNFFFQLLGSLAELDRKQMLEQLTHGRDRVAKSGKWTDGLIPYGYTVDTTGHLIPSLRVVEALGLTEAEVVRDLFARLAAGSSSVIEARRLNALRVPTTRYYSNGTPRAGTKWHPGPVAGIIANPTYRGLHVYQSRNGAIAREVPSLVDAALWDQANLQIARNRHLPRGNATRLYLLRGLITCGLCDSAYVGQVYTNRNGTTGACYRCCGRSPDHYARTERCRARVANAAWLESVVWEDCRTFIRNPGEALAEAGRQVRARLHQVARVEAERGHYMQALADKTRERDRIMLLYRRGRMTVQAAEAQMDEITREEADLRSHLSALDAQHALAGAAQAHLTEASLMLNRLQAQVGEIDRTDDRAAKRQVIELLVRHIRVDTHPDRTLSAAITYAFSPSRVAHASTSRRGSTPSRV
jgi:site-specific DNA recombinase